MLSFDPEFFIPFLVFAVPITAIVGGITLAVVRAIGRQRLVELAQQERIAAIHRGIDPAKLPPLPTSLDDDEAMLMGLSGAERDRRRAQGLLIGGLITAAAGFGLLVFLMLVERDSAAWGVGIIPITVGAALLLSAWIVHPKGTAAPRV